MLRQKRGTRASAPRRAVRVVKARLTTIRPDRPGVIVFALPRGGSTMVADALGIEAGVWLGSEPFITSSKRRGAPVRQRMVPDKPHSQMFALSGTDQAMVDRYFDALLAGELKTVGMTGRPKAGLRSDRVVLKVLNAPWQLARVAERTNAKLLVVPRHPASQALSMVNRGWTPPLDAYLDAPEALLELFSPLEVEELQRRASGADELSRALLSWIVQTRPLLRWRDRADAFWTYEDIVTQPERFVEETAVGQFGFTEREVMLTSLAAPSNSIRFSDATTRNILEAGEREAALNRWKGALTREERRHGQQLLEKFEVALYRFVD